MLINMAEMVDAGDQAGPVHVPRIDKHTLPSRYRFGLKRTVPPPVVISLTIGGLIG